MSSWTNAEWAAWISAIATVLTVAVAYWQLGNLNKTLRMNGLMAVLQIETEMNGRKQRVDEIAAQIRMENLKSDPNSEIIQILGDQMDGYLENWLNCADRLAFCIRNKYVRQRDWKVEYRTYFNDLVRNHEDKFRANTLYHNILDLNQTWHRT